MQNRKNIGYDETKKMLDTIRKLTESTTKKLKTLKEEELTKTENDVDVINDVDIKILSTDSMDMKLTDNQKNSISELIDSFRQQVSEIADLEPGLTINMDQIRLDGSISNVDISFVLIAGDESGFYVNADMLKIETETMTMIDKLSKFQMIFEDTLNPIIRERNNN